VKIDGQEISQKILLTQYSQIVEVYELRPGVWVDLASSIQWSEVAPNHWENTGKTMAMLLSADHGKVMP